MNFLTWQPIYRQIIADFSFSEPDDQNAARILNILLEKHPRFIPFLDLKPIINKKNVVVIGASTKVSNQINHNIDLIKTSVCICADGATSALIKHKIIPDIIVTDLDGNINDQLQSNSEGSILVIHAHGDNIETIKIIIPAINGKITGTVQTDPSNLAYVSNVGGFTDGDRAAYLAAHFNASKISLIGFDFHGPIGSFSNPKKKDIQIKKKKLLWAERLINILKNKHYIEFVDEFDEMGSE